MILLKGFTTNLDFKVYKIQSQKQLILQMNWAYGIKIPSGREDFLCLFFFLDIWKFYFKNPKKQNNTFCVIMLAPVLSCSLCPYPCFIWGHFSISFSWCLIFECYVSLFSLWCCFNFLKIFYLYVFWNITLQNEN